MSKKHKRSIKPGANKTRPVSTRQTTAGGGAWKLWLPVVAACAVYLIILSYPLLGLDDHAATVENQSVINFSLGDAFSRFNLGMYAPLSWAAYAIPYSIGGDSGFGYHLLSLLVHVFNTWLVVRLLLRLQVAERLRFPIALLFAVHPIQAESVAWVAGFSTPFYALFVLLGLLFYLRFSDAPANKRLQWYGLALLMMVLGNLAKSAAVVLPLLLVIVDWWRPSTRGWRSRIIGYAPFFLIALAFGLLTIYSRNVSGTAVGTDATGFSPGERFLLVCYAPMLYLYKTLLPLKLNVYYSFDKVDGQLPWPYWVAPLALAGLAYAAFRFRKTVPGLYIGLAFFLANIFFTLPFVTLGTFELCADHYNYLACIGVFFALGSVFLHLSSRYPAYAGLLSKIIVVWIALIAFLGFRQVLIWKDTISVISHAIDNGAHHNGMMHFGRGVEYGDLGQPQKAIEDFSKALEFNPDLRDAYKFRGSLYGQAGQIEPAMQDLEKYLKYDSTDAVIWNNLGMIYMRQNKLPQALEAFTKTIQIKPGAAVSYANRARIYEMMGNLESANADRRTAQQLAGRTR